MSVRAKFRCHKTAHIDHGGFNDPVTEVTLTAVYGQGENAAWSQATPKGDIRMTITNPAASGEFVAGSEYWVDFTEVEPTPVATDVVDDGKGNVPDVGIGDVIQVPGLDGDHVIVGVHTDGNPILAAVSDIPPVTPTDTQAPAAPLAA